MIIVAAALSRIIGEKVQPTVVSELLYSFSRDFGQRGTYVEVCIHSHIIASQKNEPTRRYLGSTLPCGICWASCSKSQFALFLVELLGNFFLDAFFMDLLKLFLRCLLSEVSLWRFYLFFLQGVFRWSILQCLVSRVSCHFLFLCGAVIQLFPHEIHVQVNLF